MSTAPAMLSFTFEDTQLRGFEEGGESWFVAQDACSLLGLGNPSQALAKLDDDEKGIITSDTLGGFQQLLIVSESGLYALIFRSRKPVAKRIRKWVTQEVLPTIRKTGRYEYPANDGEEGCKAVAIADTLGLDSPDDIERLRVKIALIREARHAYGPKSARGLWEAIGLPDIHRVETLGGDLTLDDPDTSIRDWLAARCQIEPGARTRATELYKDYVAWSKERDEVFLSQAAFGRCLTRSGLRPFHSEVTWRKGIRLKD